MLEAYAGELGLVVPALPWHADRSRVAELGARRIVYVSCNPTTLAGNAPILAEGGYTLTRLRPFDLFPHTPHVECVARFDRE